METARLPYTRHNVVVAGASLLITASYWWLLHSISANTAEQTRHGYEGEASFIVEIPLLFLLMYTGAFSLVALLRALRRGSEPMPSSQLLLGLLPTGLFALLTGWLMWHWAHRVV